MSFEANGVASWGVVERDEVIDLGTEAPSLRAALPDLAKVTQKTDGLARHKLSAVTYLPPIPNPDKIICIGLNYASHILEGGRPMPEKPTIFTRWANSQVGHDQAIVRPKVSETLDFEGELAVIVGAAARHVSEPDAMAVVAGYSCYNDGSVREWQRHSSQFGPGKNFPGTGGFGPYLVTPDEAGDVTRASLVTRLNGEEMQRATIDDLVFTIPKLIAYCSTFTELAPGDVIITGTTGGVGAYRTPPVWMKPGDVVEVEISGVGLLRNTVVEER
ncbi:MAG: fumarylacetoacetate hydrolase family protein [Acetobacteraceae bacterium]|nr:fumarylacetoacetate hydrolase family protein [Acetobacteraceae bacterium]